MTTQRVPWELNPEFDRVLHFDLDGTPLCNVEIELHEEVEPATPSQAHTVNDVSSEFSNGSIVFVTMYGCMG